MSSRIFLDSSILIEYTKNSRPELFEALLEDERFDLYFGSPVISEYLFHFLAIAGNKSPLSIKMSGQIGTLLAKANPLDIFRPLVFLPDAATLLPDSVRLMRQYNLLPNDAMILALCKMHGIEVIASYDPDFEPACSEEGVLLIQSVEAFVNSLPGLEAESRGFHFK
ncbi:MAG: PIN domain-containing protein [Lewinellaceae bacterium]|nr:PIN domain-containing protein [Lewinellaceae bacterium]